jgi:hypothetical protein
MQVTIITKVNAQIIHGPDNVPAGTYYVDGINPYIEYHWTVIGASSTSVKSPNVAQGAIDEKMFITWDLNAQEHKITVEEEPLFGGYTYNLNPIPNNNVSQIPDDANINAAILDVQTNGPNGRGTVRLGPGTFYVNSILIPEGIRLEGDLTTPTILKRPDIIANDPAYNNIKMLNTYEGAPFGYLYFSFVPSTYMNSKPIEIRHLTLDGNKTVPDMVPNPNYPNPNNPNEPQMISNSDSAADEFQNSALIYLHAPYIINGNISINGGPIMNGYNAQAIGASGKVKVFINNCHFKNSGGDAVCQEGNVDLTMSDCDSKDIYRGTHTETGGADISRLTKITTLQASANVRTKAIEYETGLGGIGYNSSIYFRTWIDGCHFDRNVQFDYHGSHLLITNTELDNPPSLFLGQSGGDLVTNNCEFRFHASMAAAQHQLLSPTHAKFIDTKFFIESAPNNPFTTYNGIRFTYLAGPPYYNAHLGFDGCEFHNVTSPLLTPAYGLFLPDNANLPSTVQFYFNNCSTTNCTILPNNFNGLLFMFDATQPASPVDPLDANNNIIPIAPGVVTIGQTYTGGESEDEMKTHFGIRIIIPGPNDNNCDPTFTSTHPNTDIWFNPRASEMIAVYGNANLSNKELYINGTFDIDANLTLDDCHSWFAPEAYVELTGSNDLSIDGGSLLEASCNWWGGIVAQNGGNKLSIKGNSTIKNAGYGVQISDNALLEADEANFVDNGEQAIRITNMNVGNYLGYIKNCNFTTQQNLPGGQWDRTNTAINARWVKHLNIGDINDASSGNSFDGMYTGIKYWHWNFTDVGNSNIGIYNNTFSNINAATNDEYAKMVNCYTDAQGAAIYSKADQFQNNLCHLDVRNTSGNSPAPYFSNCDKAIVSLGNALDAKNLSVTNCLLGIMSHSIYNRDYNIENNTINNVHMGIQLSGSQRNVLVADNTITAFKTIAELNNTNIYAPIGIQFHKATSWPGAIFNQLIRDNTITINRIAGIGFFNVNVGKEFEENGNMVLFNTNSIAPPDNYNIQTLLGYFNVNNYKAKYIGNTTIGPGGNAQVWQARTSISMLMNESRMCKLDCNRLRFTRFGFFVWGNNTTTETSITHNKCNANAIPWFFLDNGSATKGTFGNVGDPNLDDNGNEFVSTTNPIDWRGMLPNPIPPYSLFRLAVVPNINQEQIITAPGLLQQSESVSSILTDEYLVIPAFFGYTDPCTDDDEYEPEYFMEPDVDSNEYSSAMAVAQDSMAYINFPTVGSWIDQYKLYLELDTDSLLLNSSPELLYFYNTTSTQTIGDIKYAAEKIALLYDSTTNASNDSLRYAEAAAANTLISSANDWEMNEKTVNDVLLFMYNNPIDSIPLYMKENVQYLASSCPFVEGTAVYRARTIYSLWEPNAIFDDRIICIQGQNKNQIISNINIDSLIESQIAEANVRMVSNNISANASNTKKIISDDKQGIKIFPNPASTFIIVEYNCESDGELILYNGLGQELLKTSLGKGRKKVQIQINDIANGMYQYKCKFENCIDQIGKLTIQK